MQTSNAIKKLEKSGFQITANGNRYTAMNTNHVISFYSQSGSINCISVKRANDNSDYMSDYHAGVFCDNLTQAIKISH
jgi:hypothetical protein